MRIFHTNDLHGSLNQAHVRTLVEAGSKSSLYFDSGDCVKAGNLAIPLEQEPCWNLMAQAGCRAGVLGNRESHLLSGALKKKLKGAAHPVLCANLRPQNRQAFGMEGRMTFDHDGLRVGVFGVGVAMVTKGMKTRAISDYLWDNPIETALTEVAALRDTCDVVIALTHIGHGLDVDLAKRSEGLDIILGGHSHTALAEPQCVEGTYICQGGSHAKFYGDYEWDPASRTLSGGLVPFAPAKD